MLISEALRWAEDFLLRSKVASPRLEAEVLLAEILRTDRVHLYAHPEIPLSGEAEEIFSIWVGRRSRNLPIAYILGKKEFWSLEFMVTPAVLIPRPETELLVELSLERAREVQAGKIVEVGCGAGAVIVSLAKELKEGRFYAIDASEHCLWVARQNARRHGVEERILFLRSNLLGALRGRRWEGIFDQVISNPPYIPRGEIPCLSLDIRLYEPLQALDGGRGGLCVYRRLIPQALRFLKPGGWLILEMGKDQSEAISDLLTRSKEFGEVMITRDCQGVDRVISARRREA